MAMKEKLSINQNVDRTISFVPMAEGDPDISPWTLSYALDQGC